MSVAVAHQVSPTGQIALREAAREASLRGTNLGVIHVVESLDHDIAEAHRLGVSDQVERVLAESQFGELVWDLHLSTGEDVAETILDETRKVGAELLVIGARRRSPVGKFLLGSVTQTIILEADVPVVVVKAPA